MNANVKILILFLAVTFQTGPTAMAQQETGIYLSRAATASFFSSAPLEDIEADNEKVSAAMNTANGEIYFRVPIKEFEFEKSLMQKHFNDQYMESDKYPEASFKGKLVGWTGTPSIQKTMEVEGELTIHGITRNIREKVNLSPNDSGFTGSCSFEVRLKDYKVKVPRMVIKNIAEVVRVSVEAEFEPSEK
jgi:polyisoprenoid-binding protein YceI